MTEVSANFFGGSPLNRLGWLRNSHAFLNAITAHPDSRWALFKAGNPLVIAAKDARKGPVAYLSTTQVRPLLGPEPFFGQGQTEGELVHIPEDAKHSPLESARHRGPPIVFLGLQEDGSSRDNSALPSSDFADPQKALAKLKGIPYFSMDVADLPEEDVESVLNSTDIVTSGDKTFVWADSRSLMQAGDPVEGAIFAVGRSMTDWNLRNKFCAGCGSPLYSMWGGWKLSCKSLLPWEQNPDKKPCITAQGLHNFAHPRTDPVVIMIAVDETGDKILMGRGKRFPGKMYSALAGFIEPAETFEDAVAREMWEEAGVRVTDVQYHSGQPWPFPANLMVGYYARADSSQNIRVDLDNELVDARWFSREQVQNVLKDLPAFNPEVWTNPDLRKAADAANPAEFTVPPDTAIAGVLIRDWASGKVQFPPLEKKGRL